MKDHLHAWHETFAPLGAPIRNEPKPALGRNWLLSEFETKNHALFSPGDVLRYSDNKRLAGTFLRYEEGGKAARYVQGGFDHIEYLEVIADDGLTVPKGLLYPLGLMMFCGASAEDASEAVAAMSASFDVPVTAPPAECIFSNITVNAGASRSDVAAAVAQANAESEKRIRRLLQIGAL